MTYAEYRELIFPSDFFIELEKVAINMTLSQGLFFLYKNRYSIYIFNGKTSRAIESYK